MLFGITPREWGDFFDDAYAQVKTAEKYGYDSIWFEEHHEHIGYLPSPIGALAMLSQHTKLRLGTNVLVLPLYHPFRLAEEISQLDCASHGRVIIGVASGYREKDFKNFGISLSERGSLMDESIVLLKDLLSKEHVSHAGKYFKIEDSTIQPRPFQKNGPPMWVGGWKRPAILRAAKLGDAWFPGPVGSFSDVLKGKKIYEHECARLGKEIPKLPIMRDLYVTENKERAIQESKSSIDYMYEGDYSSSGHPLVAGMKQDFHEWAAERFLIGSPESVLEDIENYKKNGFEYFVLRTSLKKLTNDQMISSIKLFGEKVIPHFSKKRKVPK